MKRSFLVSLAAASAVAMLPGTASATMVELGSISSSPLVAPTCPSNVNANNCDIVLTRVTALETVRAGKAYPTTVHQAGYIVAFTLGLSALSSNRSLRKTYIHNLDATYKGVPLAYLTVLHQVGARGQFTWKVTATSAENPVHLIPYLGYVLQFPLQTALPVQPGDVVALSTPTWAPVLSIEQKPTNQYAYRQSRSTNCAVPASSISYAQQVIGSSTQYKCDYLGTRTEYSVTEILTPSYPRGYVHAGDRWSAAGATSSLRRSWTGGAGLTW